MPSDVLLYGPIEWAGPEQHSVQYSIVEFWGNGNWLVPVYFWT